MKTRLEEHYLTAVRPALMEKFGYANEMQAPKLEKVVVNMGVGEAVRDSKKIEHATRELAAITGQKPVVTRAKRPMPPLSCARACRLVAKSHCGVSGCMNFLIVW